MAAGGLIRGGLSFSWTFVRFQSAVTSGFQRKARKGELQQIDHSQVTIR